MLNKLYFFGHESNYNLVWDDEISVAGTK